MVNASSVMDRLGLLAGGSSAFKNSMEAFSESLRYWLGTEPLPCSPLLCLWVGANFYRGFLSSRTFQPLSLALCRPHWEARF